MLNLIPWWARWLMLLGLVGSIYGAGLVKGLHIGQQRLEDFQDKQTALATKIALEHAAESLRRQQNATDALTSLQTRHDALSARYASLRDARPSGRRVPRLPDAAPSLSTCPGKPEQPDTAAGFLAQVEGRITSILETGDREIAKYVELWKLEQANAAKK